MKTKRESRRQGRNIGESVRIWKPNNPSSSPLPILHLQWSSTNTYCFGMVLWQGYRSVSVSPPSPVPSYFASMWWSVPTFPHPLPSSSAGLEQRVIQYHHALFTYVLQSWWSMVSLPLPMAGIRSPPQAGNTLTASAGICLTNAFNCCSLCLSTLSLYSTFSPPNCNFFKFLEDFFFSEMLAVVGFDHT